jgi:hypothetical protein
MRTQGFHNDQYSIDLSLVEYDHVVEMGWSSPFDLDEDDWIDVGLTFRKDDYCSGIDDLLKNGRCEILGLNGVLYLKKDTDDRVYVNMQNRAVLEHPSVSNRFPAQLEDFVISNWR